MEDKHVARRLVTQNDTTYNNEYCCLTVIKRAIVDNDPETRPRSHGHSGTHREWAGQHPRARRCSPHRPLATMAAVPVEASVKP